MKIPYISNNTLKQYLQIDSPPKNTLAVCEAMMIWVGIKSRTV